MHYGLFLGLAAATGIAVFAATRPAATAEPAEAPASPSALGDAPAELTAAADPTVAARLESLERRATVQDAMIARLNRTNLEQASTIVTLQANATWQETVIEGLGSRHAPSQRQRDVFSQ